MTAAVELYQPAAAELAVPDHHDTDSWIVVVQDIIKIANVIYDTPFVPDGLRGSAPAVAAAMLAGREMGLGIMTSLANIDVIKGKPTQKALLMRAMIQSQGHKWQDVDVTDTRVIIKGCRRGESEWTEVTFTAAHAKTAGIDLGKYPADKLYARATSRLARRKFADVIMGMPYSSEEAEDGTDDEGSSIGAAALPAAPVPAQRTAQRRQKTSAPAAGQPAGNEPAAGPDPAPVPGAAPAASATSAPAPGPAAPAGTGGLPPLPGEEDPTPVPSAGTQGAGSARPGTDEEAMKDAPGSVTASDNMIGKIQTLYASQMGFKRAEHDQIITVTEEIIGRELTGPAKGRTHDNLSWHEAMTLIDTLERLCALPGEPRDNLMELLKSPRSAAEIRQAAEQDD
jgi:hypothetical protein